jgi:hypothetical protein
MWAGIGWVTSTWCFPAWEQNKVERECMGMEWGWYGAVGKKECQNCHMVVSIPKNKMEMRTWGWGWSWNCGLNSLQDSITVPFDSQNYRATVIDGGPGHFGHKFITKICHGSPKNKNERGRAWARSWY